MKKRYLFFAAILAAMSCTLKMNATLINVTDSIKNNDFSGDATKWTKASNSYSSFSQSANTFEAYNTSNSSSWFYCYQTITLPAGVYKLSAGAFHRSMNNASNVILYGTTTSKEYSVGIKTLASETALYGSTPSSRATAKTAFDAGYWINTINNIVIEDENNGKGTLVVGIRNICQPPLSASSNGNIWTIWSNFKLYKLEGADLDALRDEIVIKAGNLLSEETNYNDNGTLSNAINTLSAIADENLTSTDISLLKTAMSTYRNSRISSASISKPVDVTHLISNAGFEDGQVSLVATANGHINQPKGWSISYGTTDVNNNVTIIDNKVIPAGVAAGVTLTPTEGSYLFDARYRWTTGQTMTISQKIKNLTPGKYKLSASLGKLSTNGTATLKGIVAGTNVLNSTATYTYNTVSSVNYPTLSSVNCTFDAITGDSLIISAAMVQSGQGEASILLDNIKLEYQGVLPFITPNQSTIAFTPSTLQKTLNIRSGNLSNDITLTVGSAFSLSTNSLTATETATGSGANVNITYNGTSEIAKDSIVITSGSIVQKVYLNFTEGLISISNKGYFFDQSITDARTLTVSGDLFNSIALTAPTGITLSENTISLADALAGKAITITWDGTTRVADKYIQLVSGVKKDSVLIFAVSDNVIASWDGNTAEGTGSKLTDFGWSHTDLTGVASSGIVTFNDFAVTSGVRYVTAANAAHTYKGKPWVGSRVAYLRGWGNPVNYMYNLAVTLDADKTYVFRGVAAWHNNETNPTFTIGVSTATATTGTVLNNQSVACTVKQQGEDYGFEFTPTTAGTHYLTVTSNTINDAMFGVDYLAIYQKVPTVTGFENNKSNMFVSANSSQLTVHGTQAGNVVSVYNMSGVLIRKFTATSNASTLNLKQGAYFVKVNNNVMKAIIK